MRILLAEDDESAARLLEKYLTARGHRVIRAADGREALRCFLEQEPDLVLLDVRMPEMDGWAVLDEIRSLDRQVPIIMVTVHNQTADKVRGLLGGADDYVTKPFDLPELAARIEAVYRRRGAPERSPVEPQSGTVAPSHPRQGGPLDPAAGPPSAAASFRAAVVTTGAGDASSVPGPEGAGATVGGTAPTGRQERWQVGSLVVDDRSKEVWVRGKRLHLSRKEYEVLRLLVQQPGRVFSNEEIARSAWPERPDATAEDVKKYVYLLRNKLEANPDRPAIIETVRGFGYRVVPDRPGEDNP